MLKKRKYQIIFLSLILLYPVLVEGQSKLEGKISDAADKDELGLPGANVVWAGTTIGATTNNAGYFNIKRTKQSDKLVISFVGYKTDTIEVSPDEKYITQKLFQQNETAEVSVVGKASGTFISRVDPQLTIHITGAELRKAACCNLSESFATNASVDVNYSDAATGARQIQLLGLAGIYTQILTENIPAVYGLATAYGLNYIPGPWMESIQVSKGTSSVRNGYESVAGQINVEYKKPVTSEKLYINGFINDAGREEVNANTSILLNKKLSTMIMAHGELQNNTKDHNMDGFRDEPGIKQYHLFNRWDYMTGVFTARAGFQYLEEERIGGQFSYDNKSSDTWTDGFGIKINTRRLEGFTKTGIVFPKDRSMSIGWINNVAWHEQNSYFGRRLYNGSQKSYYSSLLYQWIPQLGKQTIDAGFSFKYDLYNEKLDSVLLGRKEEVPGLFAQYTYADSAHLTVIAGIRADFHNIYGTLITPRIHLRYALTPAITLRASAGKGYRSGNILAENSFLLASSRKMIIVNNLNIEEAWNSGLSITGNIPVAAKVLKLSAEYFHTGFRKQIIVDMDADVHEVRFYNLNGKSYSNVLQIEASGQPVEGLDLLAAWRWNDVKMTIDGLLREKPLSSRYKGLFTASWLTHLRKWQYDYTLQLNGPGRVPSTASNPVAYIRETTFNAYTVMNAQVTRNFKKWHLYAGVENLTNFRQKNPIIAADDPFGNYFDTSLIWGPVHGRKIYAGFRFMLNREQ
jgi:outer membrane receptor for ferrienterochelin and colicins